MLQYEQHFQIILYDENGDDFHTIDLPSMPPRYECGDIIEIENYIDPIGGNPWTDDVIFSGKYIVKKVEHYFAKRYMAKGVVEYFCVNLTIEVISTSL